MSARQGQSRRGVLVFFLFASLFCIFIDADRGLLAARKRGEIFTDRKAVPLEMTHREEMSFFHQYEYLKFKIKYLGITAGYITMEVEHEEGKNGEKRMIFNIQGATTPFVSRFYRLEIDYCSMVDFQTLYTLDYSSYRIEKDRVYQNRLIVYPSRYEWDYYRNLGDDEPFETVKFKDRGFDVVASFYISRCVNLKKYSCVSFDSFFENKVHHTKVFFLGEKKIRTSFGKLETVKIVPKMGFRGLFLNEGDIIVYLTQDEERIPVLMESKLSVGAFKAKLIERRTKSL